MFSLAYFPYRNTGIQEKSNAEYNKKKVWDTVHETLFKNSSIIFHEIDHTTTIKYEHNRSFFSFFKFLYIVLCYLLWILAVAEV